MKTIGYYSALSTTIIATVTFIVAVLTPPLSGPWCTSGCLEYPFHNIAARFPRDYLWMYPAMLLSFAFIVLMASIPVRTIEFLTLIVSGIMLFRIFKHAAVDNKN